MACCPPGSPLLARIFPEGFKAQRCCPTASVTHPLLPQGPHFLPQGLANSPLQSRWHLGHCPLPDILIQLTGHCCRRAEAARGPPLRPGHRRALPAQDPAKGSAVVILGSARRLFNASTGIWAWVGAEGSSHGRDCPFREGGTARLGGTGLLFPAGAHPSAPCIVLKQDRHLPAPAGTGSTLEGRKISDQPSICESVCPSVHLALHTPGLQDRLGEVALSCPKPGKPLHMGEQPCCFSHNPARTQRIAPAHSSGIGSFSHFLQKPKEPS